MHLRTWNPGSLQAENARKWAAAISEMSARMAIIQGRGGDSACQSAVGNMEGVSYAVDNSPTKKYHQCEPGCDSCCHVMIGVTPPEALAMAKQFRENLSPTEMEDLRQKLAEIETATRWQNSTERAQSGIPCGLLDEQGQCRIYSARPIRCRAWCSFSRLQCQDCLLVKGPDARVSVDRSAYEIGIGAVAGLVAAVADAGLDCHVYELHSALLCALNHPDAEQRWSQGENVFSDCKCYE